MSLEQALHKLIAFQTVTGNREETDALFAWVKNELQPVPLYVREYEHNGLPILVITPTRRKRVTLWLAAHVDVVAGPQELFIPRTVDRRMYGRGANDMKFAVACYVQLLKEIGMRVREYDLGMMLTADEEWGTNSGVEYLLEKEGYQGEVTFLPDGYGSWKFEEAAKGIWGFEAITTGIAAHGSRPWHGRNAVRELCAFLTELGEEVERHFTDRKDAEHWYTTLNIGLIEGGLAHNIVAPNARATVDVRYVRKSDVAVVKRFVAKLKQKYRHVKIIVTHDEQPYGLLRTNGYARTFTAIACEQYGIECGWVRAHGSSDARFFNRAGMQTILISPKGEESHGDNEWIDLKDLERYYAVLRQFVEEVAKK